jgi:fructose-1,6-bisphosphatase I
MTGAQDGGGSINVQGEEQKRLDVVTNEVLKKALRYSGKVGTLASEEEDIPLEVSRVKNKFRDIGLRTTQFKSDVVLNQEGNYVAVFDPLDGSSNVDAGIPTGTIFGIFEEDPTAAEQCLLESDMTECLFNSLQPGTQLKAAGYCLYSSSCFFCLTLGNGINIFTLDRNIGEFILTYPNVQIPKRGKICSFNEANRHVWDKPLQDYVDAIQRGNGETGQAYSSRYIGSMVGDVHRTLLYGGIFGYPATKKNPSGKLRLLYEAAPMSFIMEQAGV